VRFDSPVSVPVAAPRRSRRALERRSPRDADRRRRPRALPTLAQSERLPFAPDDARTCDTLTTTKRARNKKIEIAICPNTEDVLIYSNADKPDFAQWKLEHTLKGHDLVVSAIDWSPVHNKIVTCSHDRNAFVWTLKSGEWKPSLS